MFHSSSNSSNLWKGIVENAYVIKRGAQSAIGNGTDSLFWDHHWVINKPLSKVVIKEIPSEIRSAIVAELWNPTMGWRWSVFAEYLPINILKRIQACVVINNATCHDNLYWNRTSNGCFSISSAMEIIRDEEQTRDNPKWEVIWRAKAQNRVRFFLWLVMHNRVMCNEVRVKRHMSDDANCPICKNNVESILHLLHDCGEAKQLWMQLCPRNMRSEFFNETDVQVWVTNSLQSKSIPSSDDWDYVFPLCLWWLWIWRNKKNFGNYFAIPVNRGEFLSHRAFETRAALTKNNLMALMKIQRNEISTAWTPPPYEWIMLNTDGAAKG